MPGERQRDPPPGTGAFLPAVNGEGALDIDLGLRELGSDLWDLGRERGGWRIRVSTVSHTPFLRVLCNRVSCPLPVMSSPGSNFI